MDELVHALATQVLAQGWVQWVSFFSGILYIYYATRNNPWCWPWGIISSGFWAYASWVQLHLFSDAILQAIYVVLGVIGWYQWVRNIQTGTQKNPALPITQYASKSLLMLIIFSLLPAVALGYFMHFTSAAFPYIDAFLTVYSLLATWMLVNRKIENWILWILINFLSVPLFVLRGGHLFGLLFLIYGVLAIKGWKTWRAQLITNY